MTPEILVFVGLVVVFILAPTIPLPWLLAGHALLGSGRWANWPPYGLGLPLLSVLAILLSLSTTWPSYGRRRVAIPPVLRTSALVFMLVAGVSLLWTAEESLAYGTEKFSRLLLLDLVPAGVLGLHVLNRGAEPFEQALRALGILTSAMLVIEGAVTGGRPELFGFNPNALAVVTAVTAGLWLRQALDPRRLRRVYAAGATAVAGVATLLLGSKSGALGLLAAAALLVIPRITKGRTRLVALGMVATVAAVIVVTAQSASAPGLKRLSLATYLQAGQLREDSASITTRLELLREAQNYWEEAPLIGQGLGGFNQTDITVFGVRIGQGDEVRYPHNPLAETAAELGLVGLIALAGVAAGSFQLFRRRPEPVSTTMIAAALPNALVGGDLSDHRFIIYGIAILSAVYASRPLHPPPVIRQ